MFKQVFTYWSTKWSNTSNSKLNFISQRSQVDRRWVRQCMFPNLTWTILKFYFPPIRTTLWDDFYTIVCWSASQCVSKNSPRIVKGDYPGFSYTFHPKKWKVQEMWDFHGWHQQFNPNSIGKRKKKHPRKSRDWDPVTIEPMIPPWSRQITKTPGHESYSRVPWCTTWGWMKAGSKKSTSSFFMALSNILLHEYCMSRFGYFENTYYTLSTYYTRIT